MRIVITGKNIDITDALRERAEKKFSKLDRYLRDDTEVYVKLSQIKSMSNTVEITIYLNGTIVRVEETTEDMYASIDRALDVVIRQMRRHRTKLDKRLRETAFRPTEEIIEPEDVQEAVAELVRVKKFTVKPIGVKDAIGQMEMLGHSFFLFLNEETNGMCVVYRRHDGNYGLLMPDNA